MSIFDSIDDALTGTVGSWNVYSTGLATALVTLIAYRIATSHEPDVHPMLLARQAVPSTVRHEGESAVYRAQASPHSMPLNAGLNVKAPDAAKWSRGRNGDLRDVWRKVVLGGENGAKGKVLTAHGSESVVEHKIDEITRQINLISQHITEQGGSRVGIYLPNSIELLATLFACSFSKNLTAVLIPFDVPHSELTSMLQRAAVDTVVTIPGSFPLEGIIKSYPSLRQLIWVVDQGNSHMDWNEVPEGTGSSVNVATWQDIITDAPVDAGTQLGSSSADTTPMDIITFSPSKAGQFDEMVSFSQANIVAGMAGQISAIPSKDRFGPSDLFLPADSLTNIHTLVLTLVALFSNTSVALTSVASNSPDLAWSSRGISPTIIVASPQTLLQTHDSSVKKLGSALAKAAHALSTRALVQEGVLGTSHFLSTFSAGSKPAIGNEPGKLRLVYVADRVQAGHPHLSSSLLSDLRIFTGARVVYALSASRVAGAVTQTALFDYRVDDNVKGHFGAPVSSVEIFFKDAGALKTTDERAQGEIYVRGPSVSGGEAALGVNGRLNDDHTLSYA